MKVRSRPATGEPGYEDLFDPPTRLVRPALLRDRLDVAIARAARRRRRVGVLSIQVRVPADLLANAAPSFDLLPLIAGRLRSAVRPDDTVGRVGEHHFVVVCNDLVEDGDIEVVAERLQSVLGVRVFLDERRSVMQADVETMLVGPRGSAREVLETLVPAG